jgi:hypothetical protein
MERTAQQAIVQKLARIITGLRAAHFLLEQGLLQEQAVIERVIDEFHEDVLFLSYGILKGETKNHKSFLIGFYEEEFDNAASAFDSTQKRPTVSRTKFALIWLALRGSAGIQAIIKSSFALFLRRSLDLYTVLHHKSWTCT